METVTPRQLEIVTFIRNSRRENGYSPSMQEIGDHLGLTKVTVFEHVGALEAKGWLVRGAKHKARSLQVSDKAQFPDQRPGLMPLVGTIAAGLPIEAIEEPQTLDLEKMFKAKGDNFVLRVRGQSMIDEQIREGDYVICQRRTDARNGETVVAIVGDGEATLKKFYREKGGKIRLQPANPKFRPIIVDDAEIRGVVIGVVRKV